MPLLDPLPSHWSADAVAGIPEQMPHASLPVFGAADVVPIAPGLDLWDMWQIQRADGSTVIVEKQVGSVGAAGRPNSLHCRWSVSLTVERTAVADAGMQATRSMTQDNVLKGSAPGWCSSGSKGIQRMVEARRDTLREKMMAMVAQDRAVILAETTDAKKRGSIG